jgi:hypothetical protein
MAGFLRLQRGTLNDFDGDAPVTPARNTKRNRSSKAQQMAVATVVEAEASKAQRTKAGSQMKNARDSKSKSEIVRPVSADQEMQSSRVRHEAASANRADAVIVKPRLLNGRFCSAASKTEITPTKARKAQAQAPAQAPPIKARAARKSPAKPRSKTLALSSLNDKAVNARMAEFRPEITAFWREHEKIKGALCVAVVYMRGVQNGQAVFSSIRKALEWVDVLDLDEEMDAVMYVPFVADKPLYSLVPRGSVH